MTDCSNTPGDYSKSNSERREKNKNNLQSYRRQLKRQRSLVSRLSMESKTSVDPDQRSTNDDCCVSCATTRLKDETLSSLSSLMVTDFTTDHLVDMNHPDRSSASEDEISTSSSSPSSSSSDDDAQEEASNDSFSGTNLFDHRFLHSHTSSTVHEFSVDLFDFCRVCRLPKSQRAQLLELFQRYLLSPNLVPASTDSLAGKFFSISLTRVYDCEREWAAEEDEGKRELSCEIDWKSSERIFF